MEEGVEEVEVEDMEVEGEVGGGEEEEMEVGNCWSILCEISSNNLFSSGLSYINLTKTAKTAGPWPGPR